ncbi:MAG TPA: cytochrome C oxidase subunit IV family protein [Planctomycetota bacterium]
MSNDHHEDHGPLFTKVLWALLALTVMTVWISRIDLGKTGNIVLGLIVAVVKASLVIAIFMHLKWEKRWWLSMVLFPAVLVAIIIFSNFPDTAMNSSHLLPAVKKIPHAGATGGGGH